METQQDRCGQALREHEMKYACRLFIRWEREFFATKARRLEAVDLFRKRRCLNSWKKQIFRKAEKLMREIKAKAYHLRKVQNAFWSALAKKLRQRKAASKLYSQTSLRRNFGLWRRKLLHSRLLKKIFKKMAVATEERKQSGRVVCLKRFHHHE